MQLSTEGSVPGPVIGSAYKDHKRLLGRIIDTYDSGVVRFYSKVRFTIININILHILGLCLRGKRRVLDIGCGFGLFGCYFASLFPELEYRGYDINPERIKQANQAAQRLGLTNARFYNEDARQIELDGKMDAVMMIDLLHHLDDASKRRLVATCASHLSDDGRMIIKDVTTRPRAEIAFTWALDVLMTRGFEMWYWNEAKFHGLLGEHFARIDTFPISDLLPYPHIVYLAENKCFPNPQDD
jgi:2-polyprenyl-3-methyl-5-hydroxy-6-metoxy-1,4-benzoquinol methylase